VGWRSKKGISEHCQNGGKKGHVSFEERGKKECKVANETVFMWEECAKVADLQS